MRRPEQAANHPPDNDQNRSWSEKWPGDFGLCSCVDEATGQPHASCAGLDPSTLECQDEEIVATVESQISRLGGGSQPWCQRCEVAWSFSDSFAFNFSMCAACCRRCAEMARGAPTGDPCDWHAR